MTHWASDERGELRVGLPDAAFNKWQYNDRNELIESGRYLGANVANTNSPVADEYRAYGFDPIGNRLTATEGARQRKSYQANLLDEYTSAAGASSAYDADGNLTSDGSRKFTYDAENRLTRAEPVTATNGGVASRWPTITSVVACKRWSRSSTAQAGLLRTMCGSFTWAGT